MTIIAYKRKTETAAMMAIAFFMAMVSHTTAMAQTMHASQSHFSTEDGLCSNAVSSIIQDDYGYIWVGTWNGLSRFDGYNFFNYKTGGSSKVPLMHNRIIEMVADQWQNIWMRMYDGRIFMLERTKDRFVNPLSNIKEHEKLKTSHTLAVTTKGEILAIMDGGGIYKMKYTRYLKTS